MRVSTPSTGGGANCSTRRAWRSSKLAIFELRSASGIGALFAEDRGHDALDARIHAGIDVRRIRRDATTAARHYRVFDDRPGTIGRRCRELLANDVRIFRM